MQQIDRFAPRAILNRLSTVTVELTPFELHRLIKLIELRAVEAASDPEQTDFADYLFLRVAQLREASR